MSDDDSQNLSARDYDDQGDYETRSASGESTPNPSDYIYVVQARSGGKELAKAQSTALLQSIPARVQSKKKSHQGEGTSTRSTEPSVSRSNLTSGEYIHLDPSGAYGTPVEVLVKEEELLNNLIGEMVLYKIDERLISIVDCHNKRWIGVHLDSLKAGLRFSLDPFLVEFVNYYSIVPGQNALNGYRILACFPRICRCHHVPCSVEFFNFLHLVKPMGKNYESGFVMIQSRGAIGKISNLPDSHRKWRNKFIRVRLNDELPFPNIWSEQVRKCVLPCETSTIRTAVQKISSERYTWKVYHSPDALNAARLPALSYEITQR